MIGGTIKWSLHIAAHKHVWCPSSNLAAFLTWCQRNLTVNRTLQRSQSDLTWSQTVPLFQPEAGDLTLNIQLQTDTMVSYFNCRLLLASLVIPYTLLGEVIFRCPTCTAERQAACPKLTATSCTEIVREPGCGCCPVCARQHGESCGVYTPRCSNGLRCYPTPDSDIMPLEQLIKGMGQCGDKKESVEPQPTVSYDIREHSGKLFPCRNVEKRLKVTVQIM